MTFRSAVDRFFLFAAIAIVTLVTLNIFPATSFSTFGSTKQIEISLPKDANLINVRDYGAKGNGISDDTEAIRQAVQANLNGDLPQEVLRNRTILFPAGTYLVSDTITWSDKNGQSSLTWQGEGFGRTILKLKDSSKAFSNSQQPHSLIEINDKEAVSDSFACLSRSVWDLSRLVGDTECNRAEALGKNYIFDLSLNIGKNNPGAIGINFNNSENGAIENVAIVSEDKKGAVGLYLGNNFVAGLVKNLTIKGFDVGISGGTTINSITLENLLLEKQNRVGIENKYLSLAIRRLLSINSVPAVSNSGKNSSIVLIDSELRGGDRNNVGIENNGQIFIRNVSIQGYQTSIALGNSPRDRVIKKLKEVTPTKITEFVSSAPLSVFAPPKLKTPPKSLNVYIEETPKFIDRNLHNWANVVNYGAKPNDGIDDSVAIQKAIDSGKNTVYFPWGTYDLQTSAIVRGKVRRMLGFNSTVRSNSSAFIFANKEYPILLERFNFTENSQLEHHSLQSVILRHTYVPTVRNVVEKSLLLLENVTTGAIAISKEQQVYAHQLNCNLSNSHPAIENDNGIVWLFGYYSNLANTAAASFNGALTEIHAGLFSANSPDNSTKIPLLINKDASVSAIYQELSLNSPFQIQIQETHHQQTKILTRKSLADRERFVMPLYFGYEYKNFSQKNK
jgi:Pectate lyase superfamily protein